MKGALAKPVHVTVVADNPATVGDLHAYLEGAGMSVDPSRSLPDSSALPPAASAVVLFPDDYERTAVAASVRALRAARPRLLLVLVTSAPHRLGSAAEPDGETATPLVIPRPAFGWTILEVIRAHVRGEFLL